MDYLKLGYSPVEAARVVGICRGSVYKLIGAGRLKALKIGSRTIVTRQSIEQLLATAPVAKIHCADLKAPRRRLARDWAQSMYIRTLHSPSSPAPAVIPAPRPNGTGGPSCVTIARHNPSRAAA
jgi:excisionase family DNA binding protein